MFRRLIQISMIIGLAACGSDNSNGLVLEVEPPVINPPPMAASCVVTLFWTPPTEHMNGAAFALTDIEQYTLFIRLGDDEGPYREVGIKSSFLTSWLENNLKGGDNIFTLTVTTKGNPGLESDPSNEAPATIDSRCTGEVP